MRYYATLRPLPHLADKCKASDKDITCGLIHTAPHLANLAGQITIGMRQYKVISVWSTIADTLRAKHLTGGM